VGSDGHEEQAFSQVSLYSPLTFDTTKKTQELKSGRLGSFPENVTAGGLASNTHFLHPPYRKVVEEKPPNLCHTSEPK